MPRRFSLMLLAAGLLAGCQSAGSGGPVPPPGPTSLPVSAVPSERDAPETPNDAGLAGFVQRVVQGANTRLAAMDNQTFVEAGEYRRCRSFVPEGSDPTATADGPDSIVQEWTDRYALAQRYQGRYKLVEIGPVTMFDDAPVARVVIRVEETSRRAIAKDEPPLQPPPAGYEPKYPARTMPISRQPSSNVHRRILPLPDLPQTPGLRKDDKLVSQALAAMEAARPVGRTTTIVFRAKYLSQTHLWYLDDGDIGKMTRFVPEWRRLEDLVTPRESPGQRSEGP